MADSPNPSPTMNITYHPTNYVYDPQLMPFLDVVNKNVIDKGMHEITELGLRTMFPHPLLGINNELLETICTEYGWKLTKTNNESWQDGTPYWYVSKYYE